MKIVVIGSVAAGTSVAAKARRNNENCEIVIYEKDTDISYSGCGLPYYIGEDYISRGNLTPRNTEWFKKRFNFDIKTAHEVIYIDYTNKKLKIRNLSNNEVFEDCFDKLVLATGSVNSIPEINGIDKVEKFYLKNVNSADKVKTHIKNSNVKKVLIVGSGFIGLELLDNLTKLNIETTVVEMTPHLLPHIDEDMSVYLENYLRKKDIKFISNETIIDFTNSNSAITDRGTAVDFDMLIFATGIKPNTTLAKESNIKLGEKGGILVNNKMQTTVPDIYAVGDCCEHLCLVNNKHLYRPLGSTANKMGRIAGDVITGGSLEFRGILGTGIFKVFDLAVAYTGLTEIEARKQGYDVEVIHNLKEDKSKYLKESKEIIIKAIADRKTEKLLGVQIIGEAGVDKRIDVFVTAMTFGAKVSDLFHLDLAYAPPFSTTKDPVMYTGMVLDNAINKGRKILTVAELKTRRDEFTVLDVRSPKDYERGHIENALNIPLAKLRDEAVNFDKNKNYVVHCNKGVTGNAAQNLLINLGFENVYNLSGGYKNYAMQKNI